MTVKEYLSRYYQAKKDIDYIEKELARLRASATDIQATDYGKVVVDGTRNSDTITNIVIRIEGKVETLEKARVKARQIMLDIEDTLDTLQAPEVREVLCQRYIELKKWEDIAKAMAYSVTHVKRLHKQGLVMLQEGNSKKWYMA